jgi:hypothetical protein
MFVVHLNLPNTEMGYAEDEIDYKKIHCGVSQASRCERVQRHQ